MYEEDLKDAKAERASNFWLVTFLVVFVVFGAGMSFKDATGINPFVFILEGLEAING